MVLIEKVNTNRQISVWNTKILFWWENIFLVQILISFFSNKKTPGWIKTERSLIWIYCQLFWNYSLKIVNNKLIDFFFKSHIHKKYFGNVYFGFSFSTYNVCTFDKKMQLVITKKSYLIAKKPKQLSVHKLLY